MIMNGEMGKIGEEGTVANSDMLTQNSPTGIQETTQRLSDRIASSTTAI
jgi:hypothetical protein